MTDRADRRQIFKSLKARTDAQRTGPERLADLMSDVFGSNWFLALNVVWFGGWIVLNVNIIPGVKAFDPFPFGFLTMVVSLEAIVLSIFVLIAQNRSERIDELRAETDLQINLIAEQETTKLLRMVSLLLEKAGIDPSKDPELVEMLAPTNVENIERGIQDQLGHKSVT